MLSSQRGFITLCRSGLTKSARAGEPVYSSQFAASTHGITIERANGRLSDEYEQRSKASEPFSSPSTADGLFAVSRYQCYRWWWSISLKSNRRYNRYAGRRLSWLTVYRFPIAGDDSLHHFGTLPTRCPLRPLYRAPLGVARCDYGRDCVNRLDCCSRIDRGLRALATVAVS